MMAFLKILIWANVSSYVYLESIGSSNSFLKKVVTVLFSKKTCVELLDSSLLTPRTTISLVFWLPFWFTFIAYDLSAHHEGGCPYLHRADVYLDDFYGAEYPSVAAQASSLLGQLFHQLGLDSSPEKDSPPSPSTSMTCLGILVDTAAFTLAVPTQRLEDLQAELTIWQASTFFTKKQLQSLPRVSSQSEGRISNYMRNTQT